MPFSLIPLPFEYEDFDGLIAPGVMRWHRETVHAQYMTAINALLAPLPQFRDKSIEEVLSHPELLPADIRDDVLFLGGGYANHQFFWKILGRNDGTDTHTKRGLPEGALAAAIDTGFGGFAQFQARFTERALTLEGSGWAFLSLAAPRNPGLEILVLPNNGSVLTLRKPGIFICDLWEHAYRYVPGGPVAVAGDLLVDAELAHVRNAIRVPGGRQTRALGPVGKSAVGSRWFRSGIPCPTA